MDLDDAPVPDGHAGGPEGPLQHDAAAPEREGFVHGAECTLSLVHRHLLALFVLFHAASVVVLSIPVPPPDVRGERAGRRNEALDAWAAVGAAVGVPPEAFSSGLAAVTRAEAALLRVVRAPFVPYADLTGAEQSWLMFGSVKDRVAVLEIEVRSGEGWRPIFVGRSATHAWRRSFWDQERMRTLVFNFGLRRGKTTLWDPMVEWVAREVADDFPDARAVRVQMRRGRVPAPEELRRTGALERGAPYWTTEREIPR